VSFDPWTLLAIVLMGAATYACRGGGYWLFRQIKPSPMLRSMLGYVPGTLFISFVVPALWAGGVQAVVGGAATLVAMVATRSLMAAMMAGIGGAWIVWALK
jgi:uncharacterized membrane protein